MSSPPTPIPPPPPPRITTLPNGIVISQTPRTITEALSLGGATYTRAQRGALTVDQKTKFIKGATDPSFTKFTIIDFTKTQSDKFLEESFGFMTQVDSLRRHLQLYGLLDVFEIQDPSTGEVTDALTAYSTLEMTQVQEWSKYLYEFADQITLENLQISLLLLLNACDDELQAKVNGELSVMPNEFKSGPTAFMIIARNIVVTTEKTVRAFTYHLQRLRLSQIQGEDVSKFVAIFKGAANRLEAANQLPRDTRALAYEGLRAGSVYGFRQILEVKWIVKSPDMKTWQSILDTAQQTYQELIAENLWLTKKKRGASFNATNPSPSSNYTANEGANKNKKKNCGKKGNGNGKGGKVDRRPPGKGEPHTRKNTDTGDEEYWCGTCPGGGRWGNHKTAGHEKWYSDFKKHVKDRRATREKDDHSESSKGNQEGKTVGFAPDTQHPSKLRPIIKSPSTTYNPSYFYGPSE